ncbi:unnamed protein product [Prorocentrum cordatum]|uniref:DUF1445 domain-containing protein n=1 Tax=Prorocentrum cordatum TaxID=2364126 RepID=A0ABN9S8N2_9DINO|nr:unnamed protein product [Polarella glacialis]
MDAELLPLSWVCLGASRDQTAETHLRVAPHRHTGTKGTLLHLDEGQRDKPRPLKALRALKELQLQLKGLCGPSATGMWVCLGASPSPSSDCVKGTPGPPEDARKSQAPPPPGRRCAAAPSAAGSAPIEGTRAEPAAASRRIGALMAAAAGAASRRAAAALPRLRRPVAAAGRGARRFCGGPTFRTAAELRLACRGGAFDAPTAGHAPGHLQANMVILLREHADDFRQFCADNAAACPLLEATEPGVFEARRLAPGSDLRSDLPRYRVWRGGEVAEERTNISDLWRSDMQAFLLGCSFSWEDVLAAAGLTPRHVEQGCNVPMFDTTIPLRGCGPFRGSMVVSMRPYRPEDLGEVARITAGFPAAHGGPVQVSGSVAMYFVDGELPFLTRLLDTYRTEPRWHDESALADAPEMVSGRKELEAGGPATAEGRLILDGAIEMALRPAPPTLEEVLRDAGGRQRTLATALRAIGGAFCQRYLARGIALHFGALSKFSNFLSQFDAGGGPYGDSFETHDRYGQLCPCAEFHSCTDPALRANLERAAAKVLHLRWE